MKVKDAIAALEKEYDPEDSIVINTWDKQDFEISESDDWEDVSQTLMDETDWSWVKQDMDEQLRSWN
jgi:hypothetical protein